MKSDTCREKRTRAPIPNYKPLKDKELLRLYDAVFLELEDGKAEIARPHSALMEMDERKQ